LSVSGGLTRSAIWASNEAVKRPADHHRDDVLIDKSALLGRQPVSVVYLSMPANLLAESLADCLMDADWEYQPMEILQASPEPPPWAAE
jgi:hypothetical protein